MIRLLLLLCAGIFITLQIGGEDRGQKRFGLLEAEQEAAAVASRVREEPASRAADVLPVLPEPIVQAPPAPEVVAVSFAPAQRLVTPVVAAPTVAETNPANVKYVKGQTVNVRSGPSTRDPVVGKLTKGEAVTVVWIEENGWARVRVEGDGIDGFMSMDFLIDKAP